MSITQPKTAAQVAAEQAAQKETETKIAAATKTATDNAAAIAQLCTAAGMPDEIHGLIAANKTPEEAKTHLEQKKAASVQPPAPENSDKAIADAAANATKSALAITQLCMLAGMPEEINGLLTTNKTPDQAREHLAAKRAAKSDALVTDGKPPEGNNDAKAWDKINAQVAQENGLKPRT